MNFNNLFTKKSGTVLLFLIGIVASIFLYKASPIETPQSPPADPSIKVVPKEPNPDPTQNPQPEPKSIDEPDPPIFHPYPSEESPSKNSPIERQRQVGQNEIEIAKMLAEKLHGEVEHVLWDGTRVDILTPTQAIEVDFAKKWAEAIGQSAYYGLVSNRPAGIILLVADKEAEQGFIYRCQTVCASNGTVLMLWDLNKEEWID